MITEFIHNPTNMLALGFALMVFAPLLDRLSRRLLGGFPAAVGIACEIIAARQGLASAGWDHSVGVAAVVHLVWAVVVFVWFHVKYARIRVPAPETPTHHCKPKLFISSGNKHVRRKKLETTWFGSISAFALTSIDLTVTDSQINVRGYLFGGYHWAGIIPVFETTRLRYQAIISCVERNGVCSPTDNPSGSDKASNPPVALNMFFNWYNKNNEVGCYPQFVSTVDGDPVSVSPAIPGGGWVTVTVGNSKVMDQANLGHYSWICPKEGEHYTTSIEPDQPDSESWDPVEAKIDEWLPK